MAYQRKGRWLRQRRWDNNSVIKGEWVCTFVKGYGLSLTGYIKPHSYGVELVWTLQGYYRQLDAGTVRGTNKEALELAKEHCRQAAEEWKHKIQ